MIYEFNGYKQQYFYITVLLIGTFFLNSCSTSYTLTNNFEADKVKKVNYVDPFCSIVKYNDLSKKYERDTNTFIVAENVTNLLLENKRAYHLTEKIEIVDSTLRLNFYKDALSLASAIDKEYKLKNKSITSNISQVLNNQNEDHLGLIIYSRNIHSKKQKQKKMETEVATMVVGIMFGAIGVGTAVILFPNSFTPLEQGGFYLLIFDKTIQKPCYYKKVVFAQNDYKDKKILKNKMDMLFKMFVIPQF